MQGLHGAGGNMLGVLHSFGYTKGLLNDLNFPEAKRVSALARHATLGLRRQGARHSEGGASAAPLPGGVVQSLALRSTELRVMLLGMALALLALLLPVLQAATKVTRLVRSGRRTAIANKDS